MESISKYNIHGIEYVKLTELNELIRDMKQKASAGTEPGYIEPDKNRRMSAMLALNHLGAVLNEEQTEAKLHERLEKTRQDGECEFDGKGICGDAHMSDVPYSDMELRIMAWAAEHPEPVYPTWYEWLTSIVAVTRKVKPDVASTLIETGLLDPIPADIAEKLGIEPKEGTC